MQRPRPGIKYAITNTQRHIKHQRWTDEMRTLSVIDLMDNYSHPLNRLIDTDNNPVVIIAIDKEDDFLEFIAQSKLKVKRLDTIPCVHKVWDDYKLKMRLQVP